MGTNSVIAVQDATGDGWRGRYCHSNGEPHYTGVQLLTILRRDGFDTAVKQLTVDRRAWSYLAAGRPEGASAARGYDNDEDFVSVPGYGTENVSDPGEDDWITDTGHAHGTDWAYVLDRQGIGVLSRWAAGEAAGWTGVGYIRIADDDGESAMGDVGWRLDRITSAHAARATGLSWRSRRISAEQLTATLGRLHYYEKAGRHTAVQILLTLVRDHGCTLAADDIDAVVGELDPVVGN